jgi:hypothetical protein
MKITIFTLLQFFLFLIVFGIGSLFPPLHLEHVLGTTSAGTRVFMADGLVLMIALYILILVVELLRKRLTTSAPWTTLALALAAGFGFAMKFGLLTRTAF